MPGFLREESKTEAGAFVPEGQSDGSHPRNLLELGSRKSGPSRRDAMIVARQFIAWNAFNKESVP
jgi:hypothetical protein